LGRISVGVVGCGLAFEYCHLPAVKRISSIEIRALADINEERIRKVVEKFGLKDAATYTDYRRLLKEADIDAVYILTPPKFHAQMIVEALKYGKHVLCEKPIATCSAEIETIRDALRKNAGNQRLILMPAHNFIFTPCFEKSLEYIREGLIGDVKEIYGRSVSNLSFYRAVTDFRFQAKGGVIEDQLPHVIYLSQNLCGIITAVKSINILSRGETNIKDAEVEVEFQGGVKGVISAAWSKGIPTLKFEINGELGSIKMDLLRAPFNLTIVKEGNKKFVNVGSRFTQYFNVLTGKHPSYVNEHLHFINLINGLAEPRVSVEEGFELTRALEMITNALEKRDSVSSNCRERVSIVRVNGNIKSSIQQSINLLGGLNIPRDARVVIKPNVCFWKNTDGMVITDPRLLGAVLEIVGERTSKITIVESDNNSGTAEKRMMKSGIMDIVERYRAEFVNLSRDESEEHEVAGFKIHIPKTVLNADYFINIPKIKTCNIANIVISVSMKNMFGILSDRKKMMFHKKLLDIILYVNKVVRQDLIIVDGIIGMEGFGPIWGRPVNLNLVISGFNPVTVDAVCCRIMGINPYAIEVLWKAYKEGMGEIDADKVEILGERIDNIKRRFSHPSLMVSNVIGALRAALKTYVS
jgi:predicted dehydrogenase/uncharacterized protein (DUF362 family)